MSKPSELTLDLGVLERALSKPWSTTTCLLATALDEQFVQPAGQSMIACGSSGAMTAERVGYNWVGENREAAIQMQRLFDNGHSKDGLGSEQSRASELRELRKRLQEPFVVEIEIETKGAL